jgi:hypothetical protein
MWFRAEALPIHDDVHDAFMALLSHSSTREDGVDMSEVSGNIEASEYTDEL